MIFKQENSVVLLNFLILCNWLLRAFLLQAQFLLILVYLHFWDSRYNFSVYSTASCRLLRILGLVGWLVLY